MTLNCDTELAEDDPVTGCKAIPDGTDPVIKVHGPRGVIFDHECQFISNTTRVFYDNVPDKNLPNGFSFENWPDVASTVKCVGKNNVAEVTLKRGLKPAKNYVFRINIQANPLFTPDYNYWFLEFNHESTAPFKGYDVFAFTESYITPLDSSISARINPSPNVVTLSLRMFNTLRSGGYLSIVAPTGFTIQTSCNAGVAIRPNEQDNYCEWERTKTDVELDKQYAILTRRCKDEDEISKWTQFTGGTPPVRCVGEEKPSNKVKIYLSLGVNKMALATVMYDWMLELTNPLSVTSDRKKWQLITYAPGAAGEEATRRLDSATIPGFIINFRVPTFTL
jgi:hypothetical protein